MPRTLLEFSLATTMWWDL